MHNKPPPGTALPEKVPLARKHKNIQEGWFRLAHLIIDHIGEAALKLLRHVPVWLALALVCSGCASGGFQFGLNNTPWGSVSVSAGRLAWGQPATNSAIWNVPLNTTNTVRVFTTSEGQP